VTAWCAVSLLINASIPSLDLPNLMTDDACVPGDKACAVSALQTSSKSSKAREDTWGSNLEQIDVLQKFQTSDDDNFDSELDASVSLTHDGYMSIAEKKSTKEMSYFIKRLVSHLGGAVVDEGKLEGFVPFYSGETSTQSFHRLLQEIRENARKPDGWVRLPPPEEGIVMWNMVRSDPWVCNLLPRTDPRRMTCSKSPDADTLNPRLLTCGRRTGGCNVAHANSFRTLYQIGSLPCCPTPPFCSAPTCAKLDEHKEDDAPQTCTKRSPSENVLYMKSKDVWPAYHGFGGSFELDTLKFIDLLSCRDNSTGLCPEKTFDMMFDLGANTGYYTEKLTVRNFAKSYVMIEANHMTAGVLQDRWGNATWMQSWFDQQVPGKKGDRVPDFHVISYALSNHSHGTLNMCLTEQSFVYNPEGCNVPISSVDDIIRTQLLGNFKEHFEDAQSLFIKIDTEGMDELVLRGMQNLLNETRGLYPDGRTRYLVNFLQFEFSPTLMKTAKERENFGAYDIKSVTQFLESIGFESFLMGPRYLPLSHGSWADEYKTFIDDANNNAAVRMNYPDFDGRVCPWCAGSETPSFTSDVFVMRASHPRATEMKVALGACQESRDFFMTDKTYTFSGDSM